GKVMHMALPISDGNVIMASDSLKSMGPPLSVGNNVTIAIGPETREEADRLFNGLSAGGNVQMPMSDAFWGGYFGSFEDKFGINWLINVDTSKEKKYGADRYSRRKSDEGCCHRQVGRTGEIRSKDDSSPRSRR